MQGCMIFGKMNQIIWNLIRNMDKIKYYHDINFDFYVRPDIDGQGDVLGWLEDTIIMNGFCVWEIW